MASSQDSGNFTVRCPCGAVLRATPRMQGKTAKCPKCDRRLRIPAPQGNSASGLTLLAPDGAPAQASAAKPSTSRACPRCHKPVSAEARICVQCGTDLQTGMPVVPPPSDAAPTGNVDAGSVSAYFRDCAKSLWMVVLPGNIIRFICLFVVAAFVTFLAVLPSFGCFMTLIRGTAILAGMGWICSYLFAVVASGAAGDDDLPELTGMSSWWDDGVVAFFKFLGTWLFLFVPAIVYAILMKLSAVQMFRDVDPIFGGLIGFGVFCWPISILVVSLGGIECFTRPDLILKTVARSFVPYLATCCMTGAAFAVAYIANHQSAAIVAALGGHPLVVAVLIAGLNIACWVIAMRCIGLYYRHFNERFAFSFG